MFIYHFKRKNMNGNKLIPLNAQKEIFPETYEQHIKKYKGREQILEKRIPPLECLWNDVLHFSPINPQLIMDVYLREDLIPKSTMAKGAVEVYKIPVAKLPEGSTVCFQSFNFDFENHSPDLDKYWDFSTSEYKEFAEVPEKQIEIWHQDKKAGRPLFWYSHTMHILSQTTVDISDCEVFQCSV